MTTSIRPRVLALLALAALATLLAGPVPSRLRAQDQPTGDRLEPNNGPDQATPLRLDEETSATLWPAGDQDCYRIDLPAGAAGMLRVRVDDVPPGFNVGASLLDRDRKPLADLGVRAGAPSASFERELASQDAVYVLLRGEGAFADQPYRLRVGLTVVTDPNEPNATQQQATPLPLGTEVKGALFPAGDQDWFKLELGQNRRGRLTLRVEDVGAELNPALYFCGPDGKELARYGRPDGLPVVWRTDLVSQGTYLVRFGDGGQGAGEWSSPSHVDNRASATPYRISAAFQVVEDAHEPNAKREEATPLTLGQETSGTIFPAGDEDWFKVTLPAFGRCSISVVGLGDVVNPCVFVLDGDGKELTQQTRADGEALLVLRDLPAGTYYVRLLDGCVGRGEWSSGSHWGNRGSVQPYRLTVAHEEIERPLEPNDTLEASTPLPLDQDVKATLFPVGDQDFYTLALPDKVRGRLIVELLDADTSLNPYLVLLDRAKAKVAELNVPTGRSKRIVHDTAQAGPMYLQVADGCWGSGESTYSSEWNNQPGRYRVRARFVPVHDAQEPNETRETAAPAGEGTELRGTFFPRGDSDFYQITLTRPGRQAVEFRLSDLPLMANGFMRLYDGTGRERWSRRVDKSIRTLVARDVLTGPGTYALQIIDGCWGWNESTYSSEWANVALREPYAFSWRAVDPGDAAEPDEDAGRERALAFPGEGTGTLYPAGDRDRFKLTLAQPEKVRVEVACAGRSIDPGVRLLDAEGKELRSVFASWVQTCGATWDLQPGSYVLAVADGCWGLMEGTYSSDWDNRGSLTPYRLRVSRAADGLPPLSAPPTAISSDHATPATARRLDLSAAAPVTFQLFPDRDAEWFDLGTSGPGELRVRVANRTEVVDPSVAVVRVDAASAPETLATFDGTQVATYRGDEAFTVNLVTAARHFIVVTAKDHGSDEPLVLEATLVPVQLAQDPPATHERARELASGATGTDLAWPARDVDQWLVKTEGNGLLTVDLDEPPDAELTCRVIKRPERTLKVLELVGARQDYSLFSHDPYGVTVRRLLETDAGWTSQFTAVSSEAPFTASLELTEPVTYAQVVLRMFDADHYSMKVLVNDTAVPADRFVRFGSGERWRDFYCPLAPGSAAGRVTLEVRHPNRTARLAFAELRGLGRGRTVVQPFPPLQGASAPDRLLEGQDCVLLSGLNHPQSYGMDRPAFREQLAAFARRGGRVIVSCPQFYTYSLINERAGGKVVDYLVAGQRADRSRENVDYLTYGRVQPWAACFHRRGALPVGVVVALPFEAPADVSSVVLHTPVDLNQMTKGDPRQVKDVEVALSVEGPDRGFVPAGRFTLPAEPGAVRFEFPTAPARFIRLTVLSNYGGDSTVLPMLEAYGPGSVDGFFGLHFQSDWYNDSVACLDQAHPLASGQARGQANGWPVSESNGWFLGGAQAGFTTVFADTRDPKRLGITLEKQVGAGRLILDTQEAGYPGNQPLARWKIHNLIDYPLLEADSFTSRGQADVREAGQYLLEVRASFPEAHSRSPYRLTATFTPSGSPREPNDQALFPTDLAPGAPVEDNLFPAGDEDWYRLAVTDPTTLSLSLRTRGYGVNPVLSLFRQDDLATPVLRLDGSLGGGFGCSEAGSVRLQQPGLYLVKVSDLHPAGRDLASYELLARPVAPTRRHESNDLPADAVALAPGLPVQACLDPPADVDWFVLDKGEGPLDVRLTDVPEDLDPALKLRGFIPFKDQQVRVLYLAGRRGASLDLQNRMPYAWKATRLDWNAPDAAQAWSRLEQFDVCILDGLHEPDEFGIGQGATQETILTWVRSGGRFLLLCPAMVHSEVSAARGGHLISFTGQWDGGTWVATNVIDGYVVQGNASNGWCCARGGTTFPQEFVVGTPGERPVALDRIVIGNTSQAPDRRIKDVDVLGSSEGPDRGFLPLGSFTVASTEDPQEFTFPSREVRYLKLVVKSNYGSTGEIQFGELIARNPSTVQKLFGVTPVHSWRRGTVQEAAAPQLRRYGSGPVNGIGGWHDVSGWFEGFQDSGFEPLLLESGSPTTRAVALFKREGKGVLALDSQQLGAPANAGGAWILHALVDIAPATAVDVDAGQGLGGEERLRFSGPPGRYYVAVAPGAANLGSKAPYRLRADYAPGRDETPPRVIGVSPPDGAAAAAPDGTIVLDLSEPVTADASAIVVQGAASGRVAVRAAFDPEGCRVLLTPGRLQNNDLVTVTVPAGALRDRAGLGTVEPSTSTFRTGSVIKSRVSVNAAFVKRPPFGVGRHQVVLRASAPLRGAPEASLQFSRGGSATVQLQPTDDRTWTGVFEVAPGTPDGPAVLSVKAFDGRGEAVPVTGDVQPVTLATTAPKAPSMAPSLVPQPGGRVQVAWPAAAVDLAAYVVFRGRTPQDLRPVGEVTATAYVDATDQDATWYYALGYVDKAGNRSTPSPAASVATDREPPAAAPTGFTARTAPDGSVHLSWTAVDGNVAGYDVWRSAPAEPFDPAARPTFRVDTGAVRLDDRPGDGDFTYRVAARDKAGNVGPPSDTKVHLDTTAGHATVSVASVKPQPPVTATSALQGRLPPGEISFEIKLSEPVVEGPTISVTPTKGSPLPLSLSKRDDLTFVGTVTLPPTAADGPLQFTGTARDSSNNTGLAVRSAPLHLDTAPPTARIGTTPPGPALAGTVSVHLVPQEPVTGPTLSARAGGATTDVALTAQADGTFTGTLVLDPKAPDGEVVFTFKATDLFGRTGGTLVSSPTFLKDSTPPGPPLGVTVRPGPDGAVVLSWNPPPQEEIVGYHVYKGDKHDFAPTEAGCLVRNQPRQSFQEKLPADVIVYYRVVALDRAGNPSAPTEAVKAQADLTPPGPPTALAGRVDDTGRVRLAWREPQGEPVSSYRLYRSEQTIAKLEGMTPTDARVDATSYVDAPGDQGSFHYAVTAVDIAGNESAAATTGPIEFDKTAPTAIVRLAPSSSPRSSFVFVRPGPVSLTLLFSEPVKDPPSLSWRLPRMPEPEGLALTRRDDRTYEATLTIKDGDDGRLGFLLQAQDLAGNRCAEPSPGTVFAADTKGPVAVTTLKAAPASAGRVSLAWAPPDGEPRDAVLTYLVFRANAPFADRPPTEPAARLKRTDHVDRPGADGTWHYQVIAVDEAGNQGAPWASTAAEALSATPPVPEGVTAQVAKTVRLQWSPTPRHSVRIYRQLAGGPRVAVATVADATSFEDAPSNDGRYQYSLVAVDRAGNESKATDPVAADYTGKVPSARVKVTPPGPARGPVRLEVEVSLPLAQPPTLAFRSARNHELAVGLTPADDSGRRFTGSLQVDEETGDGVGTFSFGAQSKDGVIGTAISEGGTLVVDTTGPTATARLLPAPPLRPGTAKVRVTLSEATRAPALLFVTLPGASAAAVPLTTGFERLQLQGELTIPEGAREGRAFFDVKAADLAGNEGGDVVGGKYFDVDVSPPKAPSGLFARSHAGGYVDLAWTPPVYAATERPDSLSGYRLYRSAAPIVSVTGAQVVDERTTSASRRDRPPADGLWHYAVCALDEAGWPSALTSAAPVESRRTPPPAPLITAATTDVDSVTLTLASQAPTPEATVTFNVYARLRDGDRQTVARSLHATTLTTTPTLGGEYWYTATEVDELGNESAPSEAKPVVFAKVAPVAFISTEPEGPVGPGGAIVTLRVSVPLSAPPSLHLFSSSSPAAQTSSSPLSLALALEGPSPDGLTYKAKLLPGSLPTGPATFRFAGTATVKGKPVTGTCVAQGATCQIDVGPPTFAMEYPPETRLYREVPVFPAGTHGATLVASKPLKAPPRLKLVTRNRQEQVLGLEPLDPQRWRTAFTVAPDLGETDGHFVVEGEDRAGNKGTVFGTGESIRVDTVPPGRVNQFRAVSLPEGKVRIEWTPAYRADGTLDAGSDRFELYASTRTLASIEGLRPLAVQDRILGFVDQPTADATYRYALRVLDRAGNRGQLSEWASVAVDRKPPTPPRNLAVRQTPEGVVELTWEAPEGEKALYYNVYLSKTPIQTVAGLQRLNERVPFTRVYGTPHEDGVYYFAVTSVDDSLNEGQPCESKSLNYRSTAPIASFTISPDIWLGERTYDVKLETTKPLARPPSVEINSESGERRALNFQGAGAAWSARLSIGPEWPEGTYGFIFRGEDAQGTLGTEIQRGPLFHVDRTAPLPPDDLVAAPDSRKTEGAVKLTWRTPKRKEQTTEVPYFYKVFRSDQPIVDLRPLTPVGEVRVEFENLDTYTFSDVPPANGTWHYAVQSLDLARNASEQSASTSAKSQSGAPRAAIRLFTDATGEKPTDRVGLGRVRVEVACTVPLARPPELSYLLEEGEEKRGPFPVELTGEGARWSGSFLVEKAFEFEQDGVWKFKGVAADGTEGVYVAEGPTFVVDTIGPVAELTVPSISKYQVVMKTNKLATPPLRAGRHEVRLTAHKELAQAPSLSYTIDGLTFPVPLRGFGTTWSGAVDVGPGHPQGEATWAYEGADRSGNRSTRIAPVRKWYRTDDNWPEPRVLESFGTCGPTFLVDRDTPDTPLDVTIERKKLGVAVLKWKEPAGDPARYRLYRALTPITGVGDLTPVADEIYAPIMVDAPPCDGNWFYAVTALDLAGNESPPTASVSLFVDSIKPELKIKPVPQGDDCFIVLEDDDAPAELTVQLRFPGQANRTVDLGGTSGELKVIKNFRGSGKSAIFLPQQAKAFNGVVQVIVHSPDPEGNIVETTSEIDSKPIAPATGGMVLSRDERVKLEIPPGVEPVIPLGAGKVRRIGGYDNLFFITHANIPTKETPTTTGVTPTRNDLDPLPPALEVVSEPYTININYPPEEPMQLKGSATQADLSGLKEFTAKLRMKLPLDLGSEAVEDPEYLKSRLKVMKWTPATKEKRGRWEPIPDEAIIMDPVTKELIVPAKDVTTYVIVSERTPPTIRDMEPDDGAQVTDTRPRVSALIVDKGTGVAVGAENRIILRLDGENVPPSEVQLSEDDPTEVRVTWPPQRELAAGDHVVSLEAEDVVGNRRVAKWRFTVDNKPPRIRDAWPKDLLATASPLVYFLADDPGGSLGTVDVRVDGRKLPARYLSDQDLIVARASNLPDGDHAVELKVQDRGGKTATHTLNLRSDATPPLLTALSPRVDNAVVTDKPFTMGLRIEDTTSAVDVASLRLWLDGERVPKYGELGRFGFDWDQDRNQLTWAPPEALAEGQRELFLHAADRNGNRSSLRVPFTVHHRPTEVRYLSESAPDQGLILVRLTKPETVATVSAVQAARPLLPLFDRSTGTVQLTGCSKERITLTVHDQSDNVVTAEIDPATGESWILSTTSGRLDVETTPFLWRHRRIWAGMGLFALAVGALAVLRRTLPGLLARLSAALGDRARAAASALGAWFHAATAALRARLADLLARFALRYPRLAAVGFFLGRNLWQLLSLLARGLGLAVWHLARGLYLGLAWLLPRLETALFLLLKYSWLGLLGLSRLVARGARAAWSAALARRGPGGPGGASPPPPPPSVAGPEVKP